MKITGYILFTAILLSLTSCAEEKDPIPKPRGYFHIQFPDKEYKPSEIDCPVNFDQPTNTVILDQESKSLTNCFKNLYYPRYGATIYLSYFPVSDNLSEINLDMQDKVYEHRNMASGILESQYANIEKKVFGTTYELMGDAAVNYLFYLTDSTDNYFVGQLFFDCAPNYDSLQPVINHIKVDIEHLIETFEWKNPAIQLEFMDQ